MVVRGADGCKGGWVVATLQDDNLTVEHTRTLDAFLDADRILIDIPIGLPETGRRQADVEARKLLGERSSCVFNAPIRAALACETYKEANARSKEASGMGLSAQSFGLAFKIRQNDTLVLNHGGDNVAEGHPELSFLAINQFEPLFPKKKMGGYSQRVTFLSILFGSNQLNQAFHVAGKAEPDDILDAVALAWSARRWALGKHREIPEVPEFDALGLSMRMIF